ncbi:hypothetical protein Bca101_009923 [Brassica carinata]
MMIASEVHLGTKNCNYQMERYVYKRRNDGTYIFDLRKTVEKLYMPARVIVAIENPQNIIVHSARLYGQRAVFKFAQLYTGANAIAGRHTPGTLTNQMKTSFSEPRLLILTDPRTDHHVKMTSLSLMSDSPMRFVDIWIPSNNKGKHIIGCLFWILSRMVLQMHGTPSWTQMDLFFYREPEEAKQLEDEEAAPQADFSAPEYGVSGGDQWTTAAIPDASWTGEAQQPISATPAVGSWNDASAADGWDTAVPPPAAVPAAGWD